MDIQTIAISGVLVLGAIALVGAFKQMKPGFGPFNLRVLGIIIVAVFATTLGIIDNGKISSAIGILGAIAGYLFGFRGKTEE